MVCLNFGIIKVHDPIFLLRPVQVTQTGLNVLMSLKVIRLDIIEESNVFELSAWVREVRTVYYVWRKNEVLIHEMEN